MVRLLIENEANVNLATADNWTPAHDAARAGHVAVLRTLLAANADMQVIYVDKYPVKEKFIFFAGLAHTVYPSGLGLV